MGRFGSRSAASRRPSCARRAPRRRSLPAHRSKLRSGRSSRRSRRSTTLDRPRSIAGASRRISSRACWRRAERVDGSSRRPKIDADQEERYCFVSRRALRAFVKKRDITHSPPFDDQFPHESRRRRAWRSRTQRPHAVPRASARSERPQPRACALVRHSPL